MVEIMFYVFLKCDFVKHYYFVCCSIEGRILIMFRLILLAGCLFAQLAVSQIISFQGHYAANESKAEIIVVVELYDSGEESSTPIWGEIHSSVNVSKGVFELQIGSVESLSQVDFSQPLWFTINVDGVKGAKKKLTEVPTSIHSKTAGKALSLKGPIEAGTTVAPNLLVKSVNGLKDDVSFEGNKGIVVSQEGQKLVFTLADSLSVVGVKGDKGDKGDQGEPGINGDFIDSVSFDDQGNIVFNTALNNEVVLEGAKEILKGDKGDQGASITAAEFDDDGNIIFRTDAGGLVTLGDAVNQLRGPKGDKGDRGEQGDQGPAGTTPWNETNDKVSVSKMVEGNTLRIATQVGVELPRCGPENVGEIIVQDYYDGVSEFVIQDRALICIRNLYHNVNEGHYWFVIVSTGVQGAESYYSTNRNGE